MKRNRMNCNMINRKILVSVIAFMMLLLIAAGPAFSQQAAEPAGEDTITVFQGNENPEEIDNRITLPDAANQAREKHRAREQTRESGKENAERGREQNREFGMERAREARENNLGERAREQARDRRMDKERLKKENPGRQRAEENRQ